MLELLNRSPLRAGLSALAAASLGGALMACSAILGLDDDLRGDDAGTDGSFSGSGDGGDAGESADATVPGSDGASSDAALSPDAARLTEASWHLDPTFGDGGLGYAELAVGDLGSANGVTLLRQPDGGILAMGLDLGDFLDGFAVTDPTHLVFHLSTQPDESFGGAFFTDGGTLLAISVNSNVDETLRELDPDYSLDAVSSKPENGLTFANIVAGGDGGDGVVAVGSASFDGGPTTAAEITVSPDELTPRTVSWGGMPGPTLIKNELVQGGATYYAALRDRQIASGESGAYASYAVKVGATTTLSGDVAGPGISGAGLTDIVVVGAQVFAVGFLDTDFILSPLPPTSDAGIPLGDVPSGSSIAYYDWAGDNLPFASQLLAALDRQQRILVGGDFHGVQLANFLVDGGTDDRAYAVQQADGGVTYSAQVDLATQLHSITTNWSFQSMLIDGDFLYVIAADIDGMHKWVLFRLVRSALP